MSYSFKRLVFQGFNDPCILTLWYDILAVLIAILANLAVLAIFAIWAVLALLAVLAVTSSKLEVLSPVISHQLPLTLPPGPQLVRLHVEALEDHVRLQAVRGGAPWEVARPHHRVEGGRGRPATCHALHQQEHWER